VSAAIYFSWQASCGRVHSFAAVARAPAPAAASSATRHRFDDILEGGGLPSLDQQHHQIWATKAKMTDQVASGAHNRQALAAAVNAICCNGFARVARCITGQNGLPCGRINDDYCDCADGSDENTTPACPSGNFVCPTENTVLPSSRVNDGVCDCCDGADELVQHTKTASKGGLPVHAAKIRCSNHCNELHMS
jgi:hypothetical protein